MTTQQPQQRPVLADSTPRLSETARDDRAVGPTRADSDRAIAVSVAFGAKSVEIGANSAQNGPQRTGFARLKH